MVTVPINSPSRRYTHFAHHKIASRTTCGIRCGYKGVELGFRIQDLGSRAFISESRYTGDHARRPSCSEEKKAICWVLCCHL